MGGGGLLEERVREEGETERAKTFEKADLRRDRTQRNGLQDRTGQSRPELDETRELILVSRRRS